jgi:hypothetical protein
VSEVEHRPDSYVDTAPQPQNHAAREELKRTENRKKRREVHVRAQPLDPDPAEETAQGRPGRDTAHLLASRSRIEPLVDDRPEPGDQEGAQRGDLEIESDGHAARPPEGREPFRDEKPAAQSEADGDRPRGRPAGHRRRAPGQRHQREQGGPEHHQRQAVEVEFRKEEGVARSPEPYMGRDHRRGAHGRSTAFGTSAHPSVRRLIGSSNHPSPWAAGRDGHRHSKSD